MNRSLLVQAGVISAGGLLMGISLFSVGLAGLGAMAMSALGVILSGLAGLATIPVEPHGTLSLSVVVFVVVTHVSGLNEGVIAATLSPLVATAVTFGRWPAARTLGSALTVGGEGAISLTAAYLVVAGLPISGSWFRLSMLSTLTLIFMFLLQLLRVGTSERVRLSRLLHPLVRNGAWHQLSLLVITALVFAAYSALGLLGIFLATVVFIELYYPWKLLGDQRDLFLKSLQMISNAVDIKDPYTAHHSQRVSHYSVLIARALGIPEDEVERIRIGALMHDIGKMGVPGAIIRKPGKLTSDEMEQMKHHVGAGASIVEGLDVLSRSTKIVQFHHENYDGTGYPSGLRGDEIPVGARIVLVADAFDALTTDRPYRKGRSAREALNILEANAGTQFDPVAVDALKHILKLSS